jgi:hypothetical protein
MKYNSNMSKVKILKDLVSSIGKIKAWSPVKQATDKKWTALTITDESGKKVLGQVQNVTASPGNSYIKTKTPEFQKYLIDNQIGRQSKTVDSQFFLDIDSQKAINKLLNKPSLKKNLGGYVETPVKGRRRDI